MTRPPLPLLLLLAAGCTSSRPAVEPLGFVVPDLERGASAEDARRLEDVLYETLDETDHEATRQRFWASLLLADLHTAAAADPFLLEPGPGGARPSRLAHLVASVEHAAHALDLVEELDGGPVPAEVTHLAPAGYDGAAEALSVQQAATLADLGFGRALDELFERAPALADPDRAPQRLTALGLRPARVTGFCSLASERLAGTDPLRAFRFAILAIEGQQRFGAAPPAGRAAALEAWILEGAPVRFVCPRSQTEYVPGRTKSPVSGVSHYEYVAVARE